MSPDEFVQSLVQLSEAHGVILSDDAAAQCLVHVQLMLEWNRRTNLTRITGLKDILIRHVLDSLIPTQWLPGSGHAADVGSGAGYPGIVLAIARPDLHMTLIESNRKKASFLKILSGRLALGNLGVLHASWQEWMKGRGVTPAVDCITMRAVRLEAVHLTDLAERALRPGGVFAFWAGPHDRVTRFDDEQATEPRNLLSLAPMSYALPDGMGDRRLLRWKKAENAYGAATSQSG